MIGLDVVHAVCVLLYDEFKRDEFAPPPLLKRMIVAGAARPEVWARLLRVRHAAAPNFPGSRWMAPSHAGAAMSEDNKPSREVVPATR